MAMIVLAGAGAVGVVLTIDKEFRARRDG